MAADLSIGEARRIALAASGFGRPRPKRKPGQEQMAAVIDRLGLLQIDYVNVLVPAHYQVPFSRLGPYDRTALDDLVYRGGQFTEQWAHEASIVPMDMWPLLRHRREAHRITPWGFDEFLARNPGYIEWVLEQVRARGPVMPADLCSAGGALQRLPNSWLGTVERAALEIHFGGGHLAIADRRPNFARAYDLSERIVPEAHHTGHISRADAQRELLRRAARALGIAAAADLADYFRMPVTEARPRIAELIEAGELRAVSVAGWNTPGYLHRGARLPREIRAHSLLSPFDPVVWYRPRCERLFDFNYRIEIFVPKPQRKWGYYVLPFLLGERLAARADLKADRETPCLRVLSAYLEPHANAGETAQAMAAELAVWAAWLGLETVRVEKRDAFSRLLRASLKPAQDRHRVDSRRAPRRNLPGK